MTSVLSGSGLSAHFNSGQVGATTSSAENRTAHARHGVVVPFFVHAGVAFPLVFRVDSSVLDGFDDVWRDEIASVCDGGGEICNLERRGCHLALPDCDGDDGEPVPGLFVSLVIVVCVWNHSSSFSREVDSELVAKTHCHHVVLPLSHGVLHGAVFGSVVEHAVEIPAKVGVAGRSDGRHERYGRGVSVASDVKSFVVEAVAAGKRDGRIDASFLQPDERLRDFEGGTRRIGSHDGSVEERLHRVFVEELVVLSSVTSDHHSWVVGRRGGETEHFAGFRLNRHDGTEFSFEQGLRQLLKVAVKSECEVLAGACRFVVFPVLIVSEGSSVHVS